jgi:hypothetical protein
MCVHPLFCFLFFFCVLQLEGSEWDAAVAKWSVAFAARVGAWGDATPPGAAAAALSEASKA